MKICLISNLYPPDVIGGAERYVEKIVKKLKDDSIENKIVIITTSQKFLLKPKIEKEGNVKIYRIWPFNLYSLTTKRNYNFLIKLIWHLIDLFNPFAYFIIKKILKKEKPELIHLNNLAGLSFSIFKVIESLKIKTILTIHDYYFICPYANLVCPLTGWRFKKSTPFFCRWYRKIIKKIIDGKINLVLAPSKFAINIFEENGFFINVKKEVLPLGIEKINEIKDQREDQFIILYVGQLSFHKGVHLLIEAVKNLKLGNKKIKLEIVGDGNFKSELKKMAKNNKEIIFYNQLPFDQIKKKYQQANIVVIPSLAPETFSLVMFEAMANGKLVVASKIGALSEYIKDGENGLLFEPGNVNHLKEILEMVINQPKMIKKIGENAIKFAQNFTFQKHWERLKEIYKKI
jgi:glycosyltransferase involved in cell wall biosynthesis